MTRQSTAYVLAAALFGAGLAGANAQENITYAVTTTNISVGHAAQSSIPLAAGFWEEEGLNVDLIGLSGATAGIQQVASGQVDFATVGPEALLIARSRGLRVKAVYTFARRPIYRIVSLSDSDITTPEDLEGKTLGVPDMSAGSVPFARAVLKTAELDPESDVQWLSVGLGAPAANAFRQGDIDAWASWDTAVAGLENGGFEFNYVDPPWMDEMVGNVVIAHEDTIASNPEAVVKVARGIAKGTIYGMENPDAAIRNHWRMYPETAPQQETDDSLAEARHIFDARFDLLGLQEGTRWGENVDLQWERIAELAIAEELVPADFDVSTSYTNDFIDEINDFDAEAIVEAASGSDW